MKIYNQEINPGEQKEILIPVAHLPSGTPIDLRVFVSCGAKPGPTLLLLGGVHGDEINGIEIVRRARDSGYFKNLVHGSIIAIPLVNTFGFIQISREFPGGKDINRSFPGTKSGSLASRVAYALRSYILPHVSIGIDFHTGGNMVYNYPQARFYKGDSESAALAKEMNMPYSIHSTLIKNSIRKIAFDKKIPMVVFEGGESSRLDEFSIQEGLRGLRNVMTKRKIKEFHCDEVQSDLLTNGKWQRAGRSGILNLYKKSGDFIKKGEKIGIITDPFGTVKISVQAAMTGMIYGHNNNPIINKGAAILHIGIVSED